MPQNKNITSKKNAFVKSVLDLREKSARDKTRLMIVEGLKEILCARKAGVVFKEIYLCRDFFLSHATEETLAQIVSKGTALVETNKEVFAKISFGERKEGILAVCHQPQHTLKDLKLKNNPLLVVVEQIEKPGNLGAILRSCDGAGVDGLILCDPLTDGYNPNVVRASIGTIFSVKTIQASPQETLAFLKQNKIQICATLPSAKILYSQAKFDAPSAIVLGSEQKGLSDFWIKNADQQIKIPMHGFADSLNVSATAAIIIYEAIRQRN